MPRQELLTRRLAALAVGVTVAAAATAVATGGSALATSPDVVISQVYGGGGNSGALFTNDYIELQNLGAAPVDLTGWTVQYSSATGTTWASTPLTGVIAPDDVYLIQEAAGATPSTPLPTPNATGTLALSGSAGKVALVDNATALACSTGCATTAGVRDLIGYGSTASSFETAPTANLSNSTAALRAGADTDNNAADFSIGAPVPRASGGGSSPTPSPSVTVTPTETPSPTPTVTVPPVTARIHDIQGATHISPLKGQKVASVPGVVFAKSASGFWMQDPTPDSDVATSEGIFVFTGAAPAVAVQDSVTVNGTVSEFRPGGSGGSTNLSTTEIGGTPTVTVLAHNAKLPAATLVGSGGRVPPPAVIDDDATGDVETSGTFDATSDGIDFWESMEGMRIQLTNPGVVGPTNSFGEFFVAPSGSSTRTKRGGLAITSTDFNPERVMVDDVLSATPTVNVGDKLSGKIIGPLDYSFGNFELLPITTPVVNSGDLKAETTTGVTSAKQLAVATFNVENLAPSDPQAKFDGLAGALVNNLKAPDLVALEEIQDNSGATDNGVVASDQTMDKLIAAITAAGGPSYRYRSIDPVNDADGGQPGGNIRQVFMYRTDRGLAFVDRAGADSTTADSVVNTGGVPSLKYSPGRIDPTSTAWNSSRKPLAGEFTFRGHTVFVIANHFNSKGGDQPLFGHFQPPSFPSETQRHQQATEVRDFVDQIRAVSSSADIVVLGDLNDFDFTRTTGILTAGGALTDLPATLPANERYTYVYEGNSEVLDHILISPALAGTSYKYDVVHLNSEFAVQLSDHDPQVVRLPLP